MMRAVLQSCNSFALKRKDNVIELREIHRGYAGQKVKNEAKITEYR